MTLTIRQINEYGNYLQSVGLHTEAQYPHLLALAMLKNDLSEMKFDLKISEDKQFCDAVRKSWVSQAISGK